MLSLAAKEGLANYSPDNELVVVMDASYHYWSLVLLQTNISDINSDITKMKNLRPIMYMSGSLALMRAGGTSARKNYIP